MPRLSPSRRAAARPRRRARQRAGADRRGHRPRRHRRRLGPGARGRWRTTPTPSRPSVQIGDPFAEKLLIEACLELSRRRPLGRAAGPRGRRAHVRGVGLRGPPRSARTSTSTGAAARAGHGAVRDPDLRVAGADARRSSGPDRVDAVRAVCGRVGPRPPRVGTLRAGGSLPVVAGGRVVADVPPGPWPTRAPCTSGPIERPEGLEDREGEGPGTQPRCRSGSRTPSSRCSARRTSPSKRWVVEQYDSAGPGPDRGRARRRCGGDPPGGNPQSGGRVERTATDGTGTSTPTWAARTRSPSRPATSPAIGARPLADHQLPELRQPRTPGGHVGRSPRRSAGSATRAGRWARRSPAGTSPSTTTPAIRRSIPRRWSA